MPASGSADPTLAPTPVATQPASAYILMLIPACDDIEILEAAVPLVWPNAAQRMEELAGSRWGYYRCPQPSADVSAFYQEAMTQPPYNMREITWVSLAQGTLGLYFHHSYNVWAYVWVLPPGTGVLGAYVLVAVADALAFEPDC